MKKFLGFVAVLMAVLCLVSCSKKEEKTGMTLKNGEFSIGVNISYPPFEYYDADGKTPRGFDIELGQEIAKKLGLEAKIVDVAWEGIFAGLDTNKYDCIISAVTVTPERTKAYNFSVPYVGNGQSIIVKRGSGVRAEKPEDLAGLTVGYLTESTSDIFMTKKADEGLKFIAAEYDDAMNSFADLKNGRCDVVVSDSLVAADYVYKENSPFEIVWQGAAEEFFAVTMKKNNSELTDAVNNALKALASDGTLKNLSIENFGSDIVSSLN